MDPISRISRSGSPDPAELMALAALRRVGGDQRGRNERERKRRLGAAGRADEAEPDEADEADEADAGAGPGVDSGGDLDEALDGGAGGRDGVRRQPPAVERRRASPERTARGGHIDISA